jgi:hypothetical protein
VATSLTVPIDRKVPQRLPPTAPMRESYRTLQAWLKDRLNLTVQLGKAQ